MNWEKHLTLTKKTHKPLEPHSCTLKSTGFCKLRATKQTYFRLLKIKKKRKRNKARPRQKPTVARTPGHDDNVMTSPAAVPRILRENQKLTLKYGHRKQGMSANFPFFIC